MTTSPTTHPASTPLTDRASRDRTQRLMTLTADERVAAMRRQALPARARPPDRDTTTRAPAAGHRQRHHRGRMRMDRRADA